MVISVEWPKVSPEWSYCFLKHYHQSGFVLLFCLNPLRSSLSPLVRHDIPHDTQGALIWFFLLSDKVKQSAIKKNKDLTGEGMVGSFSACSFLCSPFVLLSCIPLFCLKAPSLFVVLLPVAFACHNIFSAYALPHDSALLHISSFFQDLSAYNS